MIKKSITPKQTAKFLNELLKIDNKAINNMFLTNTECNTKLAKHPTVQVRRGIGQIREIHYHVRPIGILNGLFGADEDGWGCICMDMKKGKIQKFRLIKKEDKK